MQVREKKGGETGFVRRQQHPSPSLLHLSVSFAGKASKTATASFYPLRFHAFPAGSELLFAREPRCRPLCLASVCILIVGPLSLLYLALPDMEKERKKEREREGRVVNPRDPFQSSVSTIVVVFTDARFSEETSSIDASRRVRTDES